MFSYGLGDAGTGLVATQFGFFLFKFFISAGLPVIIAGSLLMLIKIWDAVNDPLIGWLSVIVLNQDGGLEYLGW